MTRHGNKSHLGKRDVALIVQLLEWARYQDITVAEAARERLVENEIDLCGYRRELRSGPRRSTVKMLEIICNRLEAESSRIRRLTSMFASWRTDQPETSALRELSQP